MAARAEVLKWKILMGHVQRVGCMRDLPLNQVSVKRIGEQASSAFLPWLLG